MTRALVIAAVLAGCSGGGPTDAPDGANTPVKLFNASAALPDLEVRADSGAVLAQGLQPGASTDYVPVPLQGRLSLTSQALTTATAAHDLTEGSDYSCFVVGGEAPFEARFVEDDFADAIPGIGHLRMVVTQPDLPAPADVYVDGSVLAGDLSLDGTFVSGWLPVSAGTTAHPIRFQVPGFDDWTTELEPLVVADNSFTTLVFTGPAAGGERVVMGVNPH